MKASGVRVGDAMGTAGDEGARGIDDRSRSMREQGVREHLVEGIRRVGNKTGGRGKGWRSYMCRVSVG